MPKKLVPIIGVAILFIAMVATTGCMGEDNLAYSHELVKDQAGALDGCPYYYEEINVLDKTE